MIVSRCTCKLLGFFSGDSTEMAQITLISDEHDDNVWIGVVAKFTKPAGDVFVGWVLADIVHKQRADSTAVISRSYSTVPLLACGVPDLGLDGFSVDLD